MYKCQAYIAAIYKAVHQSYLVAPGSKMVGYVADKETPVIVFRTPEGKHLTMAGNFTDKSVKKTIKIGKKYLNMNLAPHSFNTFTSK